MKNSRSFSVEGMRSDDGGSYNSQDLKNINKHKG
jgi:hypothetical protein